MFKLLEKQDKFQINHVFLEYVWFIFIPDATDFQIQHKQLGDIGVHGNKSLVSQTMWSKTKAI